MIYDSDYKFVNMNEMYPKVKLFTKSGCTLCDKVVEVLKELRPGHPHSLYTFDITNNDK